MSDNGGIPAGWYPDPENPGQSRYWDGTQWAAPSAPVASPDGGGAGGTNRTALIVVAVVVVLALIGGGAWALTSGDGDDDEVASEDDDRGEDRDDEEEEEGQDDNQDAEPLDLDEAKALFIEEADTHCLTILESVRDIPLEYFPGATSAEDIQAVDPNVREDFRNEVLDAIEGPYDELRNLVNPTSEEAQENWAEFVDDWQETYSEVVDAYAYAFLPISGTLQYELDVTAERAYDFGLRCFEDLAPASPQDPADDTADDGGGSDAGGDVVGGPPTEPPSLGDGTLDVFAQTCYYGDMDACDSLYLATPIGSPGEAYGDTCGGRTAGGTPCTELTDPINP